MFMHQKNREARSVLCRSRRNTRARRRGFRGFRLEPLEVRRLLASDFGDAPAPYPTTLADGGAEHEIVAGFHLGTAVDSELDGQPLAMALGDDQDTNPNDEDGVTAAGLGGQGTPGGSLAWNSENSFDVFVTNTAGVPDPYLDAWIDFNQDGDWDDEAERIVSQPVTSGVNMVTFSVSSQAQFRETYARFRLHSATIPGLTPVGFADTGEVEDHRVHIGFSATVPTPAHTIFATSDTYSITDSTAIPPPANQFGGLAAADWVVTDHAFQAGAVPNWDGTTPVWQAILSITSENARDRLFSNDPVFNTHGVLVADSYHDLWDSELLAAIRFDEFGSESVSEAWTGTIKSGDPSESTCSDWLDSSAVGKRGQPGVTTSSWTIGNGDPRQCTVANSLYGISPSQAHDTPGQTQAFPLPPTAIDNVAERSYRFDNLTEAQWLELPPDVAWTLQAAGGIDQVTLPSGLPGTFQVSAGGMPLPAAAGRPIDLPENTTELRIGYSTATGQPLPHLPVRIATEGKLLVQPEHSYIVDRQLFYNDSAYDLHDPAANPADDAAIATDKQALVSGEATFANYTNYVRGINGVMIDVEGLPAGISLDPATDFTFQTGNDHTPTQWTALPVLPSVTLRAGAGGVDRIVLTWPNGVIRNTWLKVRVHATTNTGLASDDLFYFGNLIGETNGDGAVDAADFAATRMNPKTFLDPAAVDNTYDENRDQRVDALDLLHIRDHATSLETQLQLIDVTQPGAFQITSDFAGSTVFQETAEIQWAESPAATSYDLVLSSTSACDAPVYQASDISETSHVAGPLTMGLYYVCVSANNGSGTIVATNNGINLSFDLALKKHILFVTALDVAIQPNAGGVAISGLSDMDNYCESIGSSQIGVGTWKALISTEDVDARDRFADTLFIETPGGGLIADDKDDLFDGSVITDIRTPGGSGIGNTPVWTGSNPDGTFSGHACNSWTTGSDSYSGTWGNSFDLANTFHYSPFPNLPCNTLARIYCIASPVDAKRSPTKPKPPPFKSSEPESDVVEDAIAELAEDWTGHLLLERSPLDALLASMVAPPTREQAEDQPLPVAKSLEELLDNALPFPAK